MYCSAPPAKAGGAHRASSGQGYVRPTQLLRTAGPPCTTFTRTSAFCIRQDCAEAGKTITYRMQPGVLGMGPRDRQLGDLCPRPAGRGAAVPRRMRNPPCGSGRAHRIAASRSKSLNPHCVSRTPGTTPRARSRKAAPPARLPNCWGRTKLDSGRWRDAITAAAPASRCSTAEVRVSTGVARSASKKPTNRELPLNRPRRTAAPFPGREQPTTSTGTSPASSAATRRATAGVSSTLPLSTMTSRDDQG